MTPKEMNIIEAYVNKGSLMAKSITCGFLAGIHLLLTLATFISMMTTGQELLFQFILSLVFGLTAAILIGTSIRYDNKYLFIVHQYEKIMYGRELKAGKRR